MLRRPDLSRARGLKHAQDVPPGQVMVQCSDGKRYFIAEAEYARRTIDNFLSEFPSARECTYQKGTQ